MKKISVIVPVYGVEDYLETCLESIITQTYSELEIILVDDGSTDRSGLICDEYAQKDERITVVHKSNGGLSDARNWGIDRSTGDFISFVDSDDFLSPYFYEHLIKCQEKYHVDLVSCGRYLTDEHGATKAMAFGSKSKQFTVSEALTSVFRSQEIDVAAWDKLYRRSLFTDIRFPVGKNCEDIATFYKLFEKSGAIAHSGTYDYYYRGRPESISQSTVYRTRDRVNLENHLSELSTFISHHFPDLHSEFNYYYAMNVYYLLHRCLMSHFEDKKDEKHYLQKQLRQYNSSLLKHPTLPIKDKVIAQLMLLNLYKN
ncbi:glycosyltransferase family 2 protein [Streptococcus saliviloxodontae]|uniref:Glycosyltransferase involved in cell wall biosynthesis n=1 Tax=Streptococcus saliviloxodontae TaxID=1349416 RepID=A0ABS2PKL9_9STRE|nr:glycosyltransferase [Streptococcus saliviloxodontae]MBM7635975.1 glycosyltransferase involved in cell wall biosynthesis [Streptococcus saliviloxodontae]